MTLLVSVFAVAFLRDGYGGYARKNADELAASLGMTGDDLLVINPELTRMEGVRLASEFSDAGGLAGVRDFLGEPATGRENAFYFVGPGGHLMVKTPPGQPATAAWIDGGRSETDQAIQRWVGYALAVVTLVFVVQLIRVLATRATLSAAGLRVPGHAPIPLDDIQTIRAAGNRGAAVELGFAAGDQAKTVVLDPYIIGRLDILVAAIAEARGIPNPLAETGSPET